MPDWDRRLARMVTEHISLPGVWGTADCLLTDADAVVATTGHDFAAGIRSRYKTSRGALGLLKRRGFDDVEEALISLFPIVGTLMAQRGDLGIVERDGMLAAGFVCDRGFAVKIETGLLFLPQTAIKTAFKIG
ncbi:DUF6950 family protein [Mesorhizobium australicum]|uniref:DUF6950 family protein n=1 Tax=Mesorhizobium australicum TaxID=536018 RepID=UPI003339E7B6